METLSQPDTSWADCPGDAETPKLRKPKMYMEKLWVDMSDMFDVRRDVLPQDQALHKAIKSVSETGASFPRPTEFSERLFLQSESNDRKNQTHNPRGLTTDEAATKTPREEVSGWTQGRSLAELTPAQTWAFQPHWLGLCCHRRRLHNTLEWLWSGRCDCMLNGAIFKSAFYPDIVDLT